MKVYASITLLLNNAIKYPINAPERRAKGIGNIVGSSTSDTTHAGEKKKGIVIMCGEELSSWIQTICLSKPVFYPCSCSVWKSFKNNTGRGSVRSDQRVEICSVPVAYIFGIWVHRDGSQTVFVVNNVGREIIEPRGYATENCTLILERFRGIDRSINSFGFGIPFLVIPKNFLFF